MPRPGSRPLARSWTRTGGVERAHRPQPAPEAPLAVRRRRRQGRRVAHGHRLCPDRRVELFDGRDFNDQGLVIDFPDLGLEDYRHSGRVDYFNDEASSVRWRIPVGCEAVLFDDKDFQGPKFPLPGDGTAREVSDLRTFQRRHHVGGHVRLHLRRPGRVLEVGPRRQRDHRRRGPHAHHHAAGLGRPPAGPRGLQRLQRLPPGRRDARRLGRQRADHQGHAGRYRRQRRLVPQRRQRHPDRHRQPRAHRDPVPATGADATAGCCSSRTATSTPWRRRPVPRRSCWPTSPGTSARSTLAAPDTSHFCRRRSSLPTGGCRRQRRAPATPAGE